MKVKKLLLGNLNAAIASGLAIVAVGLVLLFVDTPVERFTFIMPIFAGWILYLILSEVEDEEA